MTDTTKRWPTARTVCDVNVNGRAHDETNTDTAGEAINAGSVQVDRARDNAA